MKNLTVKELKAMAKELGLRGYSKLKKENLINLLLTVEKEMDTVIDLKEQFFNETNDAKAKELSKEISAAYGKMISNYYKAEVNEDFYNNSMAWGQYAEGEPTKGALMISNKRNEELVKIEDLETIINEGSEKFEDEIIEDTLWVCHDYMGEEFLTITEYKSIQKAYDSIMEEKKCGTLEKDEIDSIEVINNIPVVIIRTNKTKDMTVIKLKKYFEDKHKELIKK